MSRQQSTSASPELPKTVAFSDIISHELESCPQVKLAERLACSQQAISDYRTGKSLPPRSKIPHFAMALNVDRERLGEVIARSRKRLLRSKGIA